MKENKRSTPFRIKLADLVIRVEPMYDYVREYCADYITNESETFTVRTELPDIAYERERATNPVAFPDEYLEILCIYRKIAEKLPEYEVLLFHGSAIAVDNKGYLFTAKSGTGKSTHTGLWRECFGARTEMINDDKPLVRISRDGVVVYGTPWNGKHRRGSNISVPLEAICVLQRGEQNHIAQISFTEVYPVLLQQCYRPADKNALAKTLELLDEMERHVRFFRLGCNMEPEAAVVAYEGMKGDKG